jgi:dihydrofolate reductase
MHLPSPLRGAIVAMNANNIIGLDNSLPWHYSADLQRFKQRTLGKIIIMGRHTWESIGSKALPGRRNIVISRSPVAGIECYTNVAGAIEQCGEKDLWIIGGSQIYQTAFEFLNLLDVTLVPDRVDSTRAVRFPAIDPELWKAVETQPLETEPALVNTIYFRR